MLLGGIPVLRDIVVFAATTGFLVGAIGYAIPGLIVILSHHLPILAIFYVLPIFAIGYQWWRAYKRLSKVKAEF